MYVLYILQDVLKKSDFSFLPHGKIDRFNLT